MTLARRLWWLLAALLVLGTTTPAAAAHLRAPQGEFAGTLRFEIDSVTPALVTDTSSSIGISGRMINTGSEELTGVVARWQRGAAFTSTAGVRAEIAEPGQPEAVLTTFGPVTDTIAAGGTVPFTLKTDAFVRDRGGLGIQAPGVYPVMLNVNASFASGPASGARVGELHVLLTVASVPDGTTVVGTRQPVAMLMPLVDRPHRDPTGAFFDDDLTPLISTGGRLADVLAAAEAPGLPAGAVTLAVDPELLEELQLMGAGYTVGPYLFDITRGGATGTAAPDTTTPADTTSSIPTTSSVVPSTTAAITATTEAGSTTIANTGSTAADTTTGVGATTYQPVPDPAAVQGTGAAAAIDFLARLRELSATVPVLVLPYTDIDAVAAVRAGHPEQVAAAVERGRELAGSILGPQAQLVANVSWPIDGLVDPVALSVLRGTGQTTVVLDRAGVVGTDRDLTTIVTGSGDVQAVLASSRVPDSAVELNHFTALTGQRFFSGDTAATVVAPARGWQPDLGEYSSVSSLLGTLEAAGLVTGVRVDRVSSAAAGTAAVAALDYPAAAAARELPQGLFGRVQGLAQELASTQLALDPLATDDPATAAPADLFTDVQDGLSRQAAGGFRDDLGAVSRSNAAVEAVVDTVQQGVTLTPSTSVYTLTSSTSPLLVNIRNDLPYTAHVRIEVNAADAVRAGITVTDVGVQTVPAGRNVQVPIPAEIIRAGSSSVRVKLTTPDGAAWGPEQTLRLRSTAIGSFTVVLIIAAAGIVVLSTAIRIRTRVRQRRERIAAGLQ